MLNVQPEPWLTVSVRPAMVSVPLRAGPVVGATPNWTVPFPVPLPPLEIVIHGALLVAVHPHSGTVATATAVEPPVLATEYDSELMLKVQPELWRTTNARPPMVSVALRAGPVVGATENWTVPFPFPEPPLVIVIHDAPLDAVHSHPAPVVTAIVPEPPVCSAECDSGSMLTWHPLPCVTVNTCSPMRKAPLRAGPSHAPTRNATVPGPVPDEPDVIEIHAVSLRADHAQAASVVTLTVPDAPSAPTDREAGAMVRLQPPP
jgi:hypothetical protein